MRVNVQLLERGVAEDRGRDLLEAVTLQGQVHEVWQVDVEAHEVVAEETSARVRTTRDNRLVSRMLKSEYSATRKLNEKANVQLLDCLDGVLFLELGDLVS